jgi:hypothetical protein
MTETCQNLYNTTNGVKASTTGTIYGVYDIVGGSWEYVAAYVDNGNSNLSNNGSAIINADPKYKDIYTKNTTDDSANNYTLAINHKGDAIYETSNNIDGGYSWFGDYGWMPNTDKPWLTRGAYFGYTQAAGAFTFSLTSALYSKNLYTFRPILMVKKGL